MFAPKNQADIVAFGQEALPSEYTEKVSLPGITTLHQRSKEEIAEALANLLKSKNNIKALRYIIGESIELTLSR